MKRKCKVKRVKRTFLFLRKERVEKAESIGKRHRELKKVSIVNSFELRDP